MGLLLLGIHAAGATTMWAHRHARAGHCGMATICVRVEPHPSPPVPSKACRESIVDSELFTWLRVCGNFRVGGASMQAKFTVVDSSLTIDLVGHMSVG